MVKLYWIGCGILKESKVLSDTGIDIGSNIRRIRLEKGIKQITVIRELQLQGFNVTKETMVKWEHGNKHFPASQLRDIKEILGTTYDDLLHPTYSMNNPALSSVKRQSSGSSVVNDR